MTNRTIDLPRDIAELALSAFVATLENMVKEGGNDELKVKLMAAAQYMHDHNMVQQPLPVAQSDDAALYRMIGQAKLASEQLLASTGGTETMLGSLTRRVATRYSEEIVEKNMLAGKVKDAILTPDKAHKILIGFTLAELQKLSHKQRLAFMHENLVEYASWSLAVAQHDLFFKDAKTWGDLLNGILAIHIMERVQYQIKPIA